MSILDKFKKKKTIEKINVEPRKKKTKTSNIETFDFSTQNQDTPNDAFIGTKNRTLYRLEELEKLIEIQENTINSLKEKLNYLELNGNPNAKYVYDWSIGEYKDVRDIQINEAINAIKVQVPGSPGVYVTMDKFRVAYAQESGTSNSTKNILYQGTNSTLDNVLKDFISDRYIQRALEQSTNFDEFKQYILNTLIK